MKIKKFYPYLLAIAIITIVIVVFFAIKHAITHNKVDDHGMEIGMSILYTFLVTISIVVVNFPIFEKVKRKFPIKKNVFKRFAIGFVISSISAALIITIWFIIFYYAFPNSHVVREIEEHGKPAAIFDNIVTAVIANFMAGAIWILNYSLAGWKKATLEAEQYKRMSIESQYSALVNQINPHFLFNSMNALASLIPESPEKAVEFVNKFSKIYRYVLDVKDKIVTELKDELEFLDAYFYLQKIRYGENLTLNKQINSEHLHFFIPPLSLQLLVENAIKHNEISKSFPLEININSNGKNIIVTNNLKLKQDSEHSHGIGLQNLKERYSHLTPLEPRFFIKNNEYIAKVPLIEEE